SHADAARRGGQQSGIDRGDRRRGRRGAHAGAGRRHRQPVEGRGGAGGAEHEPDVRPGGDPRAAMLSSVTVAKIGGNEIDATLWLERLARIVAHRTTPLVVVHGGGREVTELQRTLGAEPEWRDGLRVTTPEGLRVVSMVLSGLVNKRL